MSFSLKLRYHFTLDGDICFKGSFGSLFLEDFHFGTFFVSDSEMQETVGTAFSLSSLTLLPGITTKQDSVKVCATYQTTFAWTPIFSLHCLYPFLQKFQCGKLKNEMCLPFCFLFVQPKAAQDPTIIKIIKVLNITKGPLSFVNIICQFEGVRIELQTCLF